MTFKIRIQSSGREFTVEEKETVLAAALRQGVMLAYSCRNGACGTCKGKLVSGELDYGTYESRAMSEAEKENGHALFCQAKPLSDLVIEAKEIAAAKDIPIRIMPARVVQMEKLADDVMRLSLKLAEGQRLQFLAGQYIDILLSGNLRRSFSLSTSPLSDELLQLHIRHVPGGHFTDHVFGKMKEKDLLRFQGPFGMFFLREDDVQGSTNAAGGRMPGAAHGRSLGEVLLEPTRIYVKPLLALMRELPVHAAAHITGGGLPGNVPRVLPAGVRAVIDSRAWKRPAIFDWLQEMGGIEDFEMYRTFNCGVGMVLVLDAADAEKALKQLEASGETAAIIGHIEAHSGEDQVVILK